MSIHGGSDPQVYRARRKNFYSQVGKKWIRALSDPYDILDPLPLDWSELAKIRSASETVSDIYRRYLLILRNASDELLAAIGIPPDAARLARTVYPPMDFPLLSRI